MRIHVLVFAGVFAISANLLPAETLSFVGLNLGPGAAMVYDDGAEGTDPTVGFAVGPFYAVRAGYFGFQSQVMYEMKGFAVEGEEEDITVTQYLHYLSLPLLVKLSFEVGPVLIEPYIGTDLSVLLDASAKASDSGVEAEASNTNAFNIFDLGFIAGIDSFISLTEEWYLTLDLRTVTGILSIPKDEQVMDTRNFAFYGLIGVAYKF